MLIIISNKQLLYFSIAYLFFFNGIFAQNWEGSSISVNIGAAQLPFETNEAGYRHHFPNSGIRLSNEAYRPRDFEDLSIPSLDLVYSYPLFSWLRAELKAQYSWPIEQRQSVNYRLGDPGSPSSMLVGEEGEFNRAYSAYAGKLSIAIDLLWKAEFESLLFKLGGAFGQLKMTEFNSMRFTDNNQQQELELSRVLSYYRWELGVEWRDFFSPHFGYQIGMDFSPGFQHQANSLQLDYLRFDGEQQAAEGTRIEDPTNTRGERESFSHDWFFALYLGLSYRL